MATSIDDLRRWLAEGKTKGATHMIVVCDDFDYEDYPVYVMPGQSAREVAADITKTAMQRIMESYSYALDLESQLLERRAHHWD